MSFGSEHYLCAASSYRKVFGDGSRLSSRLSGAGGAGSFRSQSLSRSNVASSAACSSASSLGLGLAYRRPPASEGLDLSQAAARTNEYKIDPEDLVYSELLHVAILDCHSSPCISCITL